MKKIYLTSDSLSFRGPGLDRPSAGGMSSALTGLKKGMVVEPLVEYLGFLEFFLNNWVFWLNN